MQPIFGIKTQLLKGCGMENLEVQVFFTCLHASMPGNCCFTMRSNKSPELLKRAAELAIAAVNFMNVGRENFFCAIWNLMPQ